MSSRPFRSVSRVQSMTSDSSTKEDKAIDYTPAYQFQKNSEMNICFILIFKHLSFVRIDIELQEAIQERTKGMIDILSKFGSSMNKWKKKWSKFYTKKTK